MPRWWPAVLALCVALAGCGGGASTSDTVRLGDGTRVSLDLPPSEQPQPEDIHGAISGVVVDDAIFPIPGADVYIRNYRLNTTSDENGLFSFTQMPPGIVVLEAHKDGYDVGLGTIEVHSGRIAKSILQAPRMAKVEPYRTTIAFDIARTATTWFTGNPDFVVPIDRAPATLVMESYWPGLLDDPALAPLRYSIQPASAPTTARVQGTGPNPLYLAFDADFFPAHEYAVRAIAEPDNFALPLETNGKLLLTFFYIDPAPSGWSLVAGDG